MICGGIYAGRIPFLVVRLFCSAGDPVVFQKEQRGKRGEPGPRLDVDGVKERGVFSRSMKVDSFISLRFVAPICLRYPKPDIGDGSLETDYTLQWQ